MFAYVCLLIVTRTNNSVLRKINMFLQINSAFTSLLQTVRFFMDKIYKSIRYFFFVKQYMHFDLGSCLDIKQNKCIRIGAVREV